VFAAQVLVAVLEVDADALGHAVVSSSDAHATCEMSRLAGLKNVTSMAECSLIDASFPRSVWARVAFRLD